MLRLTRMGKLKVFVTRNVAKQALDILRKNFEVTIWDNANEPIPRAILLNSVSNVDGLFCLLTEKIDNELLEHGVNLKVIGTMSVGYDHIDLGACKKREIKVGYTPGVLTEATAELTMSLLLCTARRIIESHESVISGKWGAWSPNWLCGQGIEGSTIGIIGLGRIGYSVAEKLLPFKVGKLLYHSRNASSHAQNIGAEFVSFSDLLKSSDFVIITCALTPDTRHLFNAEAFSQMKSNAILINTSRGGVIDQDALYDALVSNRIRAAGLDVCVPEPLNVDNRLLTLKNCVILPHIGSATEQARTAMAVLTAENILAGLENRAMPAPLAL